jgi:hypothetical protein
MMLKMLKRLLTGSSRKVRPGTMTLTLDDLLREGRALQRPCVVLSPAGHGETAAVWHTSEDGWSKHSEVIRWITIDTRFIPGFDVSEARYLRISTNNEDLSGRVEILAALPQGQPLYAQDIQVLPPIDAVIACGSEKIDRWLDANNWDRSERYNDNFRDRALVENYERIWSAEYPVYSPEKGFYAVLGGWHLPHSDDDWHELVARQLLVMTIFDSEPWVEAWRFGPGEYKVISRIT